MSRALQAAVEVGTACGIRVTEPALLQETNNTVIWLRPSAVVAKVATRTDAKLDVRLEHAIGSELATLGSDFAVPVPGLEPGEHLPTGFVVTLWERLERVEAEAAHRSLSNSLVALHAALAKTRTRLPSFRAELMRARLALDEDTFMATLAPADRSFLRAVYEMPAWLSSTESAWTANDFTASRTTATQSLPPRAFAGLTPRAAVSDPSNGTLPSSPPRSPRRAPTSILTCCGA